MPNKKELKKVPAKNKVAIKPKKTTVSSKVAKKTEVKASSTKPISPAPKKSTSKIENNGLGKKLTCYNCNTKFYDLGKEDKICPKCGTDQNVKPIIKLKQTKVRVSEFDVVDETIIQRGLGEDEDTILDPDADEEDSLIDEDETES